MSLPEFVDLCSDEDIEVANAEDDKFKVTTGNIKEKANYRPSNIINGVINISSLMDPKRNSAIVPRSVPSDLSMLICRQFWKAGDYEARHSLEPEFQSCQSRMRVHPKFLHSNATSHKWAFGAIAELLDNAVDEVQNGATFVIVDKITNLRDGNPALLIQDDGGGMGPESLRCCMSFGFSDKKPDSSIGQYGNGFKTSTMRLGADVIVFSRCMNGRIPTQSVGLLSYTFLRQTVSDDVIVPMVDYKFDSLAGKFENLHHHGQKQFSSNLAMLLKWSPFATESELLEQFNDIGLHGTKIIVFNLWFNEDGNLELDFDSDPEDIMISGAPEIVHVNGVKRMPKIEAHVANQLCYSLRVYSSILYLHMPENFRIILRGQIVQPHQIANDLKYCECIKYKPQNRESSEAVVITTIGFLKEAPKIDIHGFNVYHRNRLILPFWRVVGHTDKKGRGVAGILEANFIKPTHDKQDFEKSTLYQKLEIRLRNMTNEYWDYHCHLVGYSERKLCHFLPVPTVCSMDQMPHCGTYNGFEQVVANHIDSCPADQLSSSIGPQALNPGSLSVNISETAFVTGASMVSAGSTCCHISAGSQNVIALSAPAYSTTRRSTSCNAVSQTGLPERKRDRRHLSEFEPVKRQAMEDGTTARLRRNHSTQLLHGDGHTPIQKLRTIVQENKKLRAVCKEHEMTATQLLVKVQELTRELQEVQQLYERLSIELKALDETKLK